MKLPAASTPIFFTALNDGDHITCHPFEHLQHNHWHSVCEIGRWDFDSLLRDFTEKAFYSSTEHSSSADDPPGFYNKLLCFKLTDQVFVELSHYISDLGKLVLRAPSHERAQKEFETLHVKYSRPCGEFRLDKPTLYVLSLQGGHVNTQNVTRIENPLKGRNDIALHYGDSFSEWSKGYCLDLRKKENGVSIFSGPPGTGKTSYIRHLIHKLKRTHAFYYVPVSHYSMISSPDMVHFWMQQNSQMPNVRKVIILEDAEPLLLERSEDNCRQLSNLLNVSDGLLGNLLRVQIICTINADVNDIDPAVMRSGRLIARRHFGRLSSSDAARIAQKYNLTIPDQDDYSLAEVYHSPASGVDTIPKSKLGF